jgi:hypothetical protein
MKISQREAQRLRRQVKEQSRKITDLEWDIKRWRLSNSLPEGHEIYTYEAAPFTLQWAISTAQKLEHTVIARFYNGNIIFKALPSPRDRP